MLVLQPPASSPYDRPSELHPWSSPLIDTSYPCFQSAHRAAARRVSKVLLSSQRRVPFYESAVAHLRASHLFCHSFFSSSILRISFLSFLTVASLSSKHSKYSSKIELECDQWGERAYLASSCSVERSSSDPRVCRLMRHSSRPVAGCAC